MSRMGTFGRSSNLSSPSVYRGKDRDFARKLGQTELWYKALVGENCVQLKDLLDRDPGLLKEGWNKDLSPNIEGWIILEDHYQHSAGPIERSGGRPWKGRTALHVAARRGCFELVKQILDMFDDEGVMLATQSRMELSVDAQRTRNSGDSTLVSLLDELDGLYHMDALAMAVINGSQAIVEILSLAKSNKHKEFIFKPIESHSEELRKITIEAREESTELSDFITNLYNAHIDFNFLPWDEYFFHFTFDFARFSYMVHDFHGPVEKARNVVRKIQQEILRKASPNSKLLRYVFGLQDGQGRPPLHVAIEADSNTAEYFINELMKDVEPMMSAEDFHYCLNVPDGANRTPLYRAAALGHESIVRALIEDVRVDVNATFEVYSPDPKHPGLDHVQLSERNGFQKIFETPSHVATEETEYRSTALHIAMIHGFEDVALALLEGEEIDVELECRRGYKKACPSERTRNLPRRTESQDRRAGLGFSSNKFPVERYPKSRSKHADIAVCCWPKKSSTGDNNGKFLGMGALGSLGLINLAIFTKCDRVLQRLLQDKKLWRPAIAESHEKIENFKHGGPWKDLFSGIIGSIVVPGFKTISTAREVLNCDGTCMRGFHVAAALGNPTFMKLFLDNDFNPLELDDFGNTGLHHAVGGGTIPLSVHLLDFVGCKHLLHDPLQRKRLEVEEVETDWRLRRSMLRKEKKVHASAAESFHTAINTDNSTKKAYGHRQGCVQTMLQAGVDVCKTNKAGEIASPGLDADERFVSWWYEKIASETSEDRTNLNGATNAISITAALIVTASYLGPLTPPLGYDPHSDRLQVTGLGVRIFITCDTLAFYFAIAAIIFAVLPALPVQRESIFDELRRSRRTVAVAAFCLMASSVAVIAAFAAASIAVIPDPQSLGYGGLTVTTAILGGVVCGVAIFCFCVRFLQYVVSLLNSG